MIADAVLNTLGLFVFLFVLFVLAAAVKRMAAPAGGLKPLQGGLAPLYAAAAGAMPQGGFSDTAAKLYNGGYIRTGTLAAALIASSGDALFLLLSDRGAAGAVVPLVFIQLLVGAGAGYLANFLVSWEKPKETKGLSPLPEGFGLRGGGETEELLFCPLMHAFKTALYVLLVSLVAGFVRNNAGDGVLTAETLGGIWLQPFLTALIGLIPGGAPAVLLSGAYLNGAVLFGSLAGGLCACTGRGIALLLQKKGGVKRGVLIALMLYAVSSATGVVVNGVLTLAGITL